MKNTRPGVMRSNHGREMQIMFGVLAVALLSLASPQQAIAQTSSDGPSSGKEQRFQTKETDQERTNSCFFNEIAHFPEVDFEQRTRFETKKDGRMIFRDRTHRIGQGVGIPTNAKYTMNEMTESETVTTEAVKMRFQERDLLVRAENTIQGRKDNQFFRVERTVTIDKDGNFREEVKHGEIECK